KQDGLQVRLTEKRGMLKRIAQIVVRFWLLLAAPLADKVRQVFALRNAGQPDMRPQRIDEHADLRVDLFGQHALQDETQAWSHLRGHNGEVAELLLGDAAEALHPVFVDVLRRGRAEQERRLSKPFHTLARAIRPNRKSAIEV